MEKYQKGVLNRALLFLCLELWIELTEEEIVCIPYWVSDDLRCSWDGFGFMVGEVRKCQVQIIPH